MVMKLLADVLVDDNKDSKDDVCHGALSSLSQLSCSPAIRPLGTRTLHALCISIGSSEWGLWVTPGARGAVTLPCCLIS